MAAIPLIPLIFSEDIELLQKERIMLETGLEQVIGMSFN